jgi:hypothetical protein
MKSFGQGLKSAMKVLGLYKFCANAVDGPLDGHALFVPMFRWMSRLSFLRPVLSFRKVRHGPHGAGCIVVQSKDHD